MESSAAPPIENPIHLGIKEKWEVKKGYKHEKKENFSQAKKALKKRDVEKIYEYVICILMRLICKILQ